MCRLALCLASIHQTENPRGFSEVDENKHYLSTTLCLVLFSNHYIHSDFLIEILGYFPEKCQNTQCVLLLKG
ncbi:hypothetical protein FLV31_07695 [Cellulophaga baltica]|nr:hypothetical protein [Cellulophaga baltica]